jgi:hypothetical protein
MIYITTATTYPLGKVFGVRVEINQATTGIVTISDSDGPKAIIAATTAVSSKEYWGFNGSVSIVNASAENITVSTLNRGR